MQMHLPLCNAFPVNVSPIIVISCDFSLTAEGFALQAQHCE